MWSLWLLCGLVNLKFPQPSKAASKQAAEPVCWCCWVGGRSRSAPPTTVCTQSTLYLQHEQQVLEKTATGIYNSGGKKLIQLPTKTRNDLSWNLENVHFNMECVANNLGVIMESNPRFKSELLYAAVVN